MRSDIAEKLATLPHAPGVYLMKDARGEVFYVGKAKSLRDRVRSYFTGTDTRAFVALLDELLADIEVVLTNNEKEALLAEDDLVKRYQPRFNVELKDDKHFLCLRLDTRVPYPRLEVVRGFGKDGARYFGPYTSAQAVRETLRIINRHFQLRTCSDSACSGRTRPCLQCQIKRCPGPCVYDLSHGEYEQNVDNVVRFLEGDHRELVATLRERMRARAAALDFEAAAQLRDQIRAIERSLERQEMVTSDFANRDVVGLYREGPAVEIHVMRIRDGRLSDAQRFSFDGLELPKSELLADFAMRYYASQSDVPAEILFPEEMEWSGALAEVLSDKSRHAVEVRAPRRGNKRRLVELAERNAAQAFRDKQRDKGAAKTAVERLQRALHLTHPPHTLECFDISHLGGTAIVASAVRFEDGVPSKELYRHYRIRSTAGQDDFQSMYEVLSRRARRGLEEGDLPDLIVIDGGRGQLNAARAALDDNGIDTVDLVALAKARLAEEPATLRAVAPVSAAAARAPESAVAGPPALSSGVAPPAAEAAAAGAEGPASAATDALAVAAPVKQTGQRHLHRRGRATAAETGKPERVFVLDQKEPVVLGQHSAELFLLTRARDEAHRFAIGFQRRQRKRAITRSILDDIPGIGATRRRALLQAFGSVAELRGAAEADIAKVVGPKIAQAVLERLRSDETPVDGPDVAPAAAGGRGGEGAGTEAATGGDKTAAENRLRAPDS